MVKSSGRFLFRPSSSRPIWLRTPDCTHPGRFKPPASQGSQSTSLLTLASPREHSSFDSGLARTGLLQLDKYVAWWREVETPLLGGLVAAWQNARVVAILPGPHPVDLSRYYRIGEMESGEELYTAFYHAVTIVDAAGSEGY